MSETDILKENFYIKKIINVIKNENRFTHKLLKVNSRHSDAFVYILSGSCTYSFSSGRSFTVAKGDILYLAHNSVYDMYINSDDYKFIFCDFEFDGPLTRKSDFYTPQDSSYCENLFRRLLSTYLNPDKASFSESLSVLYRIYNVAVKSDTNKYLAPTAKNKIKLIKEYINVNFMNPNLSVKELAERADMSEVYLRKLFGAKYGIPPAQYITSVRIEKAKEFMRYPFLSLDDCALKSGFSSLQYFCRVFKKAVGVTPYKYRKGML